MSRFPVNDPHLGKELGKLYLDKIRANKYNGGSSYRIDGYAWLDSKDKSRRRAKLGKYK